MRHLFCLDFGVHLSLSLNNPQSLNRYTYVENDPVNAVDPSGLFLQAPRTLTIPGFRDASWGNFGDNWFGGSGGWDPSDWVFSGGQGPAQQANNQNPCGVNPVTGNSGFTSGPRGVPGNLRPGVGGLGHFNAPRGNRRHAGLDISGVSGVSSLHASQAGTVTAVNNNSGIVRRADGSLVGVGYGRSITIDHGSGFTTRYAHNARNDVQVGDQVTRGQLIGVVGQTGNAYGQLAAEAHVHFETRVNGVAKDPAFYLNFPCDWSISPSLSLSNWQITIPR